MSNLSLFLVVFLSGVILVVGGLGLAILISPKSFNPQKENLTNAEFQLTELRGCSSKPDIIFTLFFT